MEYVPRRGHHPLCSATFRTTEVEVTVARAPLHSPVLHMRPCALLQPVRRLGVVTKINKKPEQGRDPRHSSPQSPSIISSTPRDGVDSPEDGRNTNTNRSREWPFCFVVGKPRFPHGPHPSRSAQLRQSLASRVRRGRIFVPLRGFLWPRTRELTKKQCIRITRTPFFVRSFTQKRDPG